MALEVHSFFLFSFSCKLLFLQELRALGKEQLVCLVVFSRERFAAVVVCEGILHSQTQQSKTLTEYRAENSANSSCSILLSSYCPKQLDTYYYLSISLGRSNSSIL